MTPFTVAFRGLERVLSARSRLVYREAASRALTHFGPGGVPAALRACEAANENLAEFLRPPERVGARLLERRPLAPEEGLGRGERLVFASPRPSGCPTNDRVPLVCLRPRNAAIAEGGAMTFHHAIREDRWRFWARFLEGIRESVPVVLMAAPHHFERRLPGEFGGQRTTCANPWRLFEAIRQWSWDQAAAREIARRELGLEHVATMGFSMGAFQTLLLASLGSLPGPLVCVASTARYAWGILQGSIGAPIAAQMRRVGIGPADLGRATRSLELDRYAERLRDRDVLWIAGAVDRVDPPPSSERLRAALRPRRSVVLPAGHGTLVLFRRRIAREVLAFLEELDASSTTRQGKGDAGGAYRQRGALSPAALPRPRLPDGPRPQP